MPSNTEKEKDLNTYFDALRIEVWRKAIGGEALAKGNHYYETISKSILTETGHTLSKDTVRNFLENRHEPQPKPLDIYSTYVLGGNEENPKTFSEFQNWYHGKSTYSTVASTFSKGKKGFYVIMASLALIILMVALLLFRPDSNFIDDVVKSTSSAKSSPNVEMLEAKAPTKRLVQKLLNDFPFDDSPLVNSAEAQRIMEWLGFREMQYQMANAEPFFHGKLPTGCKIAIWVGTYGKNDTYGFRCDCRGAKYPLEPYYLEIPKPQKTVTFKQRFTNSDLASLEQAEWYLSDSPNQSLWEGSESTEDGFLTLKTYLGDSFLENKDYEPRVINVLTHSLNCGRCCDVSVKLVGFNPSKYYQQAGFFLFYDEETYPSLRMTLGYDGMVQVVKRDGKYSNTPLSGANYSVRARAFKVTDGLVQNPIDSIVLKMRIEDGQYFFSHKVDDGAFIDIMSQKLPFPKPIALGLAAFQGRPEIPFPVYPVTEPIPAKFEYVVVEPCK